MKEPLHPRDDAGRFVRPGHVTNSKLHYRMWVWAVLAVVVLLVGLFFVGKASAHTTGSHHGWKHIHTCWHTSHWARRHVFFHHHRRGCNGYSHHAPSSPVIRGGVDWPGVGGIAVAALLFLFALATWVDRNNPLRRRE